MSALLGVKKRANWLLFCLSVGWNKADLDFLEGLWDKYHDEHGNLI